IRAGRTRRGKVDGCWLRARRAPPQLLTTGIRFAVLQAGSLTAAGAARPHRLSPRVEGEQLAEQLDHTPRRGTMRWKRWLLGTLIVLVVLGAGLLIGARLYLRS